MSKIQPKLSFVVVRLNGRNVVAVRATVGASVKFQEHLDRMTFLGESDRCEAELVKAQREAEAECRAAVKAIKDLDEKASYADVAKAQKRLDAALVLAELESVEEIPEEVANGRPFEPGEAGYVATPTEEGLLKTIAELRAKLEAADLSVERAGKGEADIHEELVIARNENAALKKEILGHTCAVPAEKPPEPAPAS